MCLQQHDLAVTTPLLPIALVCKLAVEMGDWPAVTKARTPFCPAVQVEWQRFSYVQEVYDHSHACLPILVSFLVCSLSVL